MCLKRGPGSSKSRETIFVSLYVLSIPVLVSNSGFFFFFFFSFLPHPSFPYLLPNVVSMLYNETSTVFCQWHFILPLLSPTSSLLNREDARFLFLLLFCRFVTPELSPSPLCCILLIIILVELARVSDLSVAF
eukprot:TRINITY_DN11354_c0_g1::TRINITY_DN11354_c0_g1_i1::g.26345::m.26345 TRINITY_DN11354_c0_g1::TRINITY_DN11354_c0_g1_i1::g.26345  ORF type:complete len:133 (-),score=-20.28,DUF4014/PF13198.1/2.8e+02,DUF4014/PF13198.1/1.6 TRINITY_DN11354_c0_g1_i1:135-533(-)